jgi:hyperosmotically inducible protein
MKLLKLLPALMLAAFFSGCAPKDSDIQAKVQEKLKANQATASTVVMVNDGIATLSGELADETARAESEKLAGDTKGVKSVINNITVTPPTPPAAPVTISGDDTLMNGVRDATKDHPTVTATVNDGVITLTGSIEKSKLPALIQTLNSLNPKKVENKLTVK